MLASVLTLLHARATALLFALLLALLLGWVIPQLLEPLVHRLTRLAVTLGRRLNRRRDVSTRAWRGVIAMALFVLPAMALAALAERALGAFAFLIPAIIFAYALRLPLMLKLRRQTHAQQLALQIHRPDYLFPDSHALLRYRLLDHSQYFAIGIVGVSFWYLLGGAVLALGYLALALAATQYATEHDDNRAFGGVAVSLFRLSDTIPRALSGLILCVAAVFVPGTHPRKAATKRTWPHFLAQLLDIALGGPIPLAHRTYQLAWVGTGTPKLQLTQLHRWLAVWAVALVMVIVFLLPSLIQLSY